MHQSGLLTDRCTLNYPLREAKEGETPTQDIATEVTQITMKAASACCTHNRHTIIWIIVSKHRGLINVASNAKWPESRCLPVLQALSEGSQAPNKALHPNIIFKQLSTWLSQMEDVSKIYSFSSLTKKIIDKGWQSSFKEENEEVRAHIQWGRC